MGELNGGVARTETTRGRKQAGNPRRECATGLSLDPRRPRVRSQRANRTGRPVDACQGV